MEKERPESARADTDKIIAKLNDLDTEWQHSLSVKTLFVECWRRKGKQVRFYSNEMRYMPIITVRDTYIRCKVYPQSSPDKELQLAIALVKTLCGDYDDLPPIMELPDLTCKIQINENESCTIIARQILALLHSNI